MLMKQLIPNRKACVFASYLFCGLGTIVLLLMALFSGMYLSSVRTYERNKDYNEVSMIITSYTVKEAKCSSTKSSTCYIGYINLNISDSLTCSNSLPIAESESTSESLAMYYTKEHFALNTKITASYKLTTVPECTLEVGLVKIKPATGFYFGMLYFALACLAVTCLCALFIRCIDRKQNSAELLI